MLTSCHIKQPEHLQNVLVLCPSRGVLLPCYYEKAPTLHSHGWFLAGYRDHSNLQNHMTGVEIFPCSKTEKGAVSWVALDNLLIQKKQYGKTPPHHIR